VCVLLGLVLSVPSMCLPLPTGKNFYLNSFRWLPEESLIWHTTATLITKDLSYSLIASDRHLFLSLFSKSTCQSPTPPVPSTGRADSVSRTSNVLGSTLAKGTQGQTKRVSHLITAGSDLCPQLQTCNRIGLYYVKRKLHLQGLVISFYIYGKRKWLLSAHLVQHLSFPRVALSHVLGQITETERKGLELLGLWLLVENLDYPSGICSGAWWGPPLTPEWGSYA
jgi:hypothetical protein